MFTAVVNVTIAKKIPYVRTGVITYVPFEATTAAAEMNRATSHISLVGRYPRINRGVLTTEVALHCNHDQPASDTNPSD